jgi:hypothetical protein
MVSAPNRSVGKFLCEYRYEYGGAECWNCKVPSDCTKFYRAYCRSIFHKLKF